MSTATAPTCYGTGKIIVNRKETDSPCPGCRECAWEKVMANRPGMVKVYSAPLELRIQMYEEAKAARESKIARKLLKSDRGELGATGLRWFVSKAGDQLMVMHEEGNVMARLIQSVNLTGTGYRVNDISDGDTCYFHDGVVVFGGATAEGFFEVFKALEKEADGIGITGGSTHGGGSTSAAEMAQG